MRRTIGLLDRRHRVARASHPTAANAANNPITIPAPLAGADVEGPPQRMNRVLPYLLGPELYWAVTYMIVQTATRRNLAPDPAITGLLDRYWAVLPLIVVPLTFALFLVPGSSRWGLLLRIDLAIAVGLAMATTQYCEGMTYHQPSAGPGAGTAWMLMMGSGYALMLAGTAIAAAVIWWAGRGTA